MTEINQTRPKRDLPLWAAVTVIVLGLVGAGWFVWSQISAFWMKPSGGPFALESAPARPNAPINRPPEPALNVREITKDALWQVRSGPHTLRIRKQDGARQFAMTTFSQKALPEDSKWLILVRGSLNAGTIKEIGLSKEQVAAIRALPLSPTLPVSLDAAQQNAFRQLFEKYLAADAADRSAADRELTKKLGELGQAMLPQVEALVKKQYADLKASMPEDQWAKLRELAKPKPAPAAPTTAPVQQ